MKRKLLQLICLSLSVLVAFSMLAGCGAGKTGNGSDVQSTGAKAPEQDKGVAKDGFPVVKDKITLRFMAPQAAGFRNLGEMDTFKKYEEMTNIHINWTMVPSSAINEKRNLSLATGDLPDAYFGMQITASDESNYGPQGVLLPLEGLTDSYMPNFKKLAEKYPSVKPQIISPDSHIYTLPEVNERLRDQVWGRLFINKKWVDTLGLKMPSNTEEFYNMLKQFKEKDPNGNGKADEIPLNSLLDLGSWGLSDARKVYIDIDNGKLRFIAVDPMYKEFLEYHARLFKEKLLDQEVFSQDRAQITAKGEQGLIGSSIWSAPHVYVGTKIWTDYALANPPLKGPKGHQTVDAEGVDNLRILKGTFAMTKADKHPEATARWVDWLYTVEGDRLFLSGIEGKHYKANPDGTWQLLLPEGKTRIQFMGEYTFTQGGNFPRIFTGDAWGLKEVATDVNQVANNAAKAYQPFVPKEILPNLNFTQEEQKRLNVLQADINTYVDQMRTKFIMNAEPFTNWDNYVNTIKKMGLDELMKIYQQSYDRYKKSK